MKLALIPCNLVERTDEILRPRGEALPKGGSPNRNPRLLKHNQKDAGPQRSTMNLSRRPEIVTHHQKQERVAAHLRDSDIPPGHGNPPAHESRVQKRNCGDQHEPLMRSTIAPIAEAKINQRGEN